MFLFIHYKPESYDEDGAYIESEFSTVNWLTADELVDVWAERLCRNANRESDEAEIECHIFKAGVRVWDGGSFAWDGRDRPAATALSDRELDSELDSEKTADKAAMAILSLRASARAGELAAEQKAELQRVMTAAIADGERAGREARRRQYLALKAEFEPHQ